MTSENPIWAEDAFWQAVAIRRLPETVAEMAADIETAQKALLNAYSNDQAERFAAIRETALQIAGVRGMLRHLATRFPQEA